MSYWTGKNILVTGGAGFIGSAVVKRLVEAGAKVRVADNLSKGEAANLENVSDKIDFHKVDLLNSENAKKMMEGIDVCFHFAAFIGGIGYFHKAPATSLRDNTLLNLNMWDAAVSAGGKAKMICLSSSMVFERTNIFPSPESAVFESPAPITGYGFSKLVAEYIARTYQEQYGINYVICRPFNAYGPGETPGDYVGYSHVIPDLVKKVMTGQYPVEILGDGSQTRSYTYVDDLADGIIYVSERAENDDYNIAGETNLSVLELLERIWKICGKKEPLKTVSVPTFKYDVKRRVPDTTKIKNFGWKSKVQFDEGLKKTVEWMVDNKKF